VTYVLPTDECPVYALDPERPRTLLFHHPDRNLSSRLTVRGDEARPLTVTLRPAGAMTGRFLDADGRPVVGAEVGLSYQSKDLEELDRFLARQREPVRTDPDGRFRLDGIVPDEKFALSLQKGSTSLVGKPRIGTKDVKSGATLDLGPVTVEPAPP
jgi:hypothetical protein